MAGHLAVTQGSHLEGPGLGLLPCCCHVEFLIFEQGAPHFSFLMGPINYVVGPGSGDCV